MSTFPSETGSSVNFSEKKKKRRVRNDGRDKLNWTFCTHFSAEFFDEFWMAKQYVNVRKFWSNASFPCINMYCPTRKPPPFSNLSLRDWIGTLLSILFLSVCVLELFCHLSSAHPRGCSQVRIETDQSFKLKSRCSCYTAASIIK